MNFAVHKLRVYTISLTSVDINKMIFHRIRTNHSIVKTRKPSHNKNA